jgi:hypothetical protein
MGGIVLGKRKVLRGRVVGGVVGRGERSDDGRKVERKLIKVFAVYVNGART